MELPPQHLQHDSCSVETRQWVLAQEILFRIQGLQKEGICNRWFDYKPK